MVTVETLTDEMICRFRRSLIGHPEKTAWHHGLISDCDAALTDRRAMAFQLDGVRSGIERCKQRICDAVNARAKENGNG
jgi:hypothetical protein